MLQLHKTDDGKPDYAEFLHLPKRRFSDFSTLTIFYLMFSYASEFCLEVEFVISIWCYLKSEQETGKEEKKNRKIKRRA